VTDGSLDLFEDGDVSEEASGSEDTDGLKDGASRVEPAAPPAREPKVWSVYQVNKAVRGLLDSSVEPLWVGGEIGSWTRSRSGHCYFTLKDDRAQIRGVLFAREAAALPADPDEGTKVRVFGTLTLYEARGEYQLVATKVEAEGADGLWRKAFEQLRASLEAEGLLSTDRKRPIPQYPRCIGVVTSPTGAALRDITSVLSRRAPWSRVILAGSRVQGEGASLEIADALRRLAATGLPDVIVVGRGGGSLEDLWAFNEEPVARAIAECPIPVVSAVGHEVDITIADLVADLRAPTPSAAAEAVAPDGPALLARLERIPERLGRALRSTAARPGVAVAERLSRLIRSMERRIEPARRSVELGRDRLDRRIAGVATSRRARLEALAGRLEALSPLSTLSRGYSVARSKEHRVLRTVADFTTGETFQLRVVDGSVDAVVEKTTPIPSSESTHD
jgi:exodeoxyribonuclease VII large subunit